MWKGTGRSGVGEQFIGGAYDDWDGLSMNGRQWKNPRTVEPRNLSGADYWHQRKAIEPKVQEDIPTFVNGRPNIAAFAEPVAQKKAKPTKKKSIAESIDLAERHFQRMEDMSEQLDAEYENGVMPRHQYDALRYKMDLRLVAAWERLEKENKAIWEREDSQWNASNPDKTIDKEDDSYNILDNVCNFFKTWRDEVKKHTRKEQGETWLVRKTKGKECKNPTFAALKESNFFRKLYILASSND